MEDPRDIVTTFVEQVWNRRRLALADTIIAAGCRTHQLRSGPPPVGVPRGPEAVKMHIQEWLAGFPDLTLTIEQIFAEGDRVLTQLVMDGTHHGPWLGIPPTGKPVSIRMMTVHRIQDGKIVEDWVLAESLGLLQQLGVLPSTSEILADFARRAASALHSSTAGSSTSHTPSKSTK